MKISLTAPHTVYKDSAGKRLAGVTTILGVLDKPALRGWYAGQERQGILDTLKLFDFAKGIRGEQAAVVLGSDLPAKWFAEAKRDKAADLGTVTHAHCEAWLLGDRLEANGIPDDMYLQSQHGLERFKEWWSGEGFTLMHSERVLVYDDGKMAFGGTADILAKDSKGRVVLVDLKTSKASPHWPYDEVFGQVAAYGEAAANDPKTGLDVERIVVARIGKEPGDEIQTYELSAGQRAAGWRLFRAAYDAYEAKRELSRR